MQHTWMKAFIDTISACRAGTGIEPPTDLTTDPMTASTRQLSSALPESSFLFAIVHQANSICARNLVFRSPPSLATQILLAPFQRTNFYCSSYLPLSIDSFTSLIPDLISYRSCHMSSRPLLVGSILACIFILIWSGAQPACSTMANKDEGSVHIVYVERIPDHENDIEGHHLSVLAKVCDGSREVAKEKMLYSYSQAMSGFSAKLTEDQVKTLSETPGVLRVVKDQIHTIQPVRGVGGSGPRVTKVGGHVISSLGGAANLH